MKRLTYFFISLLLFAACNTSQKSTILIHNATIIDGSAADRFLGSVRIKNNRILQIGDLNRIKTDSVINASGLILSPGFIDSHSHHDWDPYPTKDAAISQGITTIVIGQDGRSKLPVKTFYDSMEDALWSVNVATYTGHNTLRLEVMGDDFKRHATQEEVDSMRSLLEIEMQNGSLGLSTGLEYDPGIYSSTEEVIALAKTASEYGGKYISHMRSEDVNLEKSIDEIIQIGLAANIPVQISHFKLARKGLWGQAAGVLEKLDSARAVGVNISADIYPYQYWQSTMTVLFPKRDFENRESAEFALTELTTPEGMIISKFDAKPEYAGLTLDSISRLRKEDVVTTYIELIKMSQAQPAESIIAKSMDISDIVSIMNWSETNICSDGSHTGHPRGWGSFPRYLTMDTGQNLESKINKMTAQASNNLGFEKMGLIKKGYFADLVLFDPETIRDKATFENGTQRSEGIHSVIVSGKVVYKNDAPTKLFPGRIIKRSN